MLSDAQAALAKDNLGLAVDLYTRAINNGAEGKHAKKLSALLDKAVQKRTMVAHKKRDKEGEAEAKALAQRLKSLTSSRPRRRP
jgi:hypothetical protein